MCLKVSKLTEFGQYVQKIDARNLYPCGYPNAVKPFVYRSPPVQASEERLLDLLRADVVI